VFSLKLLGLIHSHFDQTGIKIFVIGFVFDHLLYLTQLETWLSLPQRIAGPDHTVELTIYIQQLICVGEELVGYHLDYLY
jgi:hypothetical protein